METRTDQLLRQLLDKTNKTSFIDKVKSWVPVVLAVVTAFAFVWSIRADANSMATDLGKISAQIAEIRTTVSSTSNSTIRLEERQRNIKEDLNRLRSSCCATD